MFEFFNSQSRILYRFAQFFMSILLILTIILRFRKMNDKIWTELSDTLGLVFNGSSEYITNAVYIFGKIVVFGWYYTYLHLPVFAEDKLTNCSKN